MADIPRHIEGAHEGKVLVSGFLKKFERNQSSFYYSADSKNIREEYEILIHELKMYNPECSIKKRVLAISKSVCLTRTDEEIRKDLPDLPRVFISSVTARVLTRSKICSESTD